MCLQLYQKETPTQGFSCDFCEIFKNTFFYRTPPVAPSEISFGGSMLGFVKHLTTSKVSVFGVFSGPYFPAFGLNTGRYGVSLRIPSECEKTRTRRTPNTGTFHAVPIVKSRSKT